MTTKYVLITGGIVSGLGKGVITSSLGALFKTCKVSVKAIKIDPYINIDAGTFSPYEHGEVFVQDDGSEVDLDLGNYERFLDISLQRDNNITTGKIYQRVIDQERQGVYLGKTVQVIPHITDAIQDWIRKVSAPKVDHSPTSTPEVCLIELGGTIGDIESAPFVEALRQFKRKVGRKNFCCIHVSLVPTVGPSKEGKSKPTQYSLGKLRECGLKPDLIILRSERKISDDVREKVSFFSDIEVDRVFNLPNLKAIYCVPLRLKNLGVLREIADCLKMNSRCDLKQLREWRALGKAAINNTKIVTIALIGKYTASKDSYHSVISALEHVCFNLSREPRIIFIDSTMLESNSNGKAFHESWNSLKAADCILVTGGFGIRGTLGKERAINYARVNKMPFLGICLGFQLAVIEYAKNVIGNPLACSAEFDETEHKGRESISKNQYVIEMLEYLDPDGKLGGTMRLGRRKTLFVTSDSILRPYYGTAEIYERHRHRYEINPEKISELENAGLKFVGKNEDGTRMEILELEKTTHPYFIGVQYHPEYLSRPFKPSPPFKGLIEAAIEYRSRLDQSAASN